MNGTPQLAAARILALLLAAMPAVRLPAQIDDRNVVERFKIETHADGVFVPVNINGKKYQFLLDTGSTYTVFDRTLLQGEPKCNIDVSAAAGDNCSVPLYEVPEACIGKTNLKDELSKTPSNSTASTDPLDRLVGILASNGWIDPRGDNVGVVGYDFSRQREISDHEIDGILGMDFLHKWAVQIDFDQRELKLSQTATPPKNADAFKIYYNDGGVPLVPCRISDWGETDFALDTGWVGGGNLKPTFAKYLLEHGHVHSVGESSVFSLSGASRCEIFQTASFALGKHQSENLIFSEGNANLLDLDYLSRYNLTFDFPKQQLYVVEGKDFCNRDEVNLSGLHLIRKEGRTSVYSVEADSPADKSGLKVGDLILKVDQLDANKETLSDIRKVLCQEKKVVQVVAEREEKQFEANVELK